MYFVETFRTLRAEISYNSFISFISMMVILQLAAAVFVFENIIHISQFMFPNIFLKAIFVFLNTKSIISANDFSVNMLGQSKYRNH